MGRDNKGILDITIRYIILILISLPNLLLFYIIFTPLTVYPLYFLLNLFFDTSLISQSTILVNQIPIELISACIAGSAYYLLLILNLSTPNIKTNKRIKILFIAFLSLLILNILRIFFLTWLQISGSEWFDFTHKLFWYVLSIFFVIGIWFSEVKYFKIKQIPFYSDIKYLSKLSKK